jgi:HlyD family secretion protein
MRAGTKRILIIGGAVVVVGAIIVANLKQKSAGKGTEVRTEAVGMRRIEAWVRAPGKVQPVSKVQVSSNVMGRVVELAVREGQQVKSGDLLLRLDDERYRSQVQQYRATILSAEASRTLAEAQAREAKQNRDRKESLSTQGLASTQELEAARTADEVAAARAASAAEDVRRARAALAEAEKNLRETVFIAPMDGTVTALNVEVGENVLTGTMNNPGTVILTLSDLASMEVLADVDETDVVNVAPLQRARVLVDAIPDTAFEGSVTRVGQSGRGLTGQSQEATNFEVAVLLKSPPSALRPGMNADVEIQTGLLDSTLAVPLQALTARPPNVVERWKAKRAGTKLADADTTGPDARNLVEGVFIDDGGKAKFIPVTMGLRGETHIEVRGDLPVGAKLITGPYRTLRKLSDQEAVRPEKQKAAGKQKKDKESDAEPKVD